MSKIADWFRRERERGVREKLLKHAELVEETAKYLVEFMKKKVKENYVDDSLFTIIDNKEHEADVLRREILRILAASKVLKPEVRMQLARIVRQADWVADWALEAARLALALRQATVSTEVVDSLVDMISEVYITVQKTRECITAMFEDPFKTLNLCDEVEKLEENVDDLYQKTRRLFVEKCSDLPIAAAILFFHMMDAIEMMADKCEDTCDNIREYVVSVA
ncbi:MAG TPA: DUF47 family protein [Thermoprotei archaeon]|nr:DUF47 family protein [Thermoprotei archaeon]